MLGIEPATQRPRMDEALDAIMRAAQVRGAGDDEDRLVRDARGAPAPGALHRPAFPDRGGLHHHAGRHAWRRASTASACCRSAPALPGGPDALAEQWKIAEDDAAKHGKTMDRKDWRLVVNMHCAEDDEQALREVRDGERNETVTYFEDTLGRPPGRADDPLREGVKIGNTLVGSPETVAKGIERLIGLQPGRLRRRPVPRARMGQPRATRCAATSCSPAG